MQTATRPAGVPRLLGKYQITSFRRGGPTGVEAVGNLTGQLSNTGQGPAQRVTQNDVVHRRYLDPNHRSYIPDFGSYIQVEGDAGKMRYVALSRQMVLYCVERRKAWRLLQSRGGIVNNDYKAQQALLKKVDSGEIELQDFLNRTKELFEAELAELIPAKKKPAMAGAK